MLQLKEDCWKALIPGRMGRPLTRGARTPDQPFPQVGLTRPLQQGGEACCESPPHPLKAPLRPIRCTFYLLPAHLCPSRKRNKEMHCPTTLGYLSAVFESPWPRFCYLWRSGCGLPPTPHRMRSPISNPPAHVLAHRQARPARTSLLKSQASQTSSLIPTALSQVRASQLRAYYPSPRTRVCRWSEMTTPPLGTSLHYPTGAWRTPGKEYTAREPRPAAWNYTATSPPGGKTE